MAKIKETNIIIKLSKLTKDDDETSINVDQVVKQQLEEIVNELIDDNVIVEVFSDNE